VGPRARKDVKLVAMMDVLIMPKREACAASTGQRAKPAAMKDVPTVPKKEESAASMGQRANHAVM